MMPHGSSLVDTVTGKQRQDVWREPVNHVGMVVGGIRCEAGNYQEDDDGPVNRGNKIRRKKE